MTTGRHEQEQEQEQDKIVIGPVGRIGPIVGLLKKNNSSSWLLPLLTIAFRCVMIRH